MCVAVRGSATPAWSYRTVMGWRLVKKMTNLFFKTEAGSDPRGHLGVTWGVYLCAGKPPLADIILSHPRDLT